MTRVTQHTRIPCNQGNVTLSHRLQGSCVTKAMWHCHTDYKDPVLSRQCDTVTQPTRILCCQGNMTLSHSLQGSCVTKAMWHCPTRILCNQGTMTLSHSLQGSCVVKAMWHCYTSHKDPVLPRLCDSVTQPTRILHYQGGVTLSPVCHPMEAWYSLSKTMCPLAEKTSDGFILHQ